MATIDISENTLLRLQANAKARRLPLDRYLETIAAEDTTQTERQLAAIKSFSKIVGQWTERNLPPDHVVDDSRESIYPDRS